MGIQKFPLVRAAETGAFGEKLPLSNAVGCAAAVNVLLDELDTQPFFGFEGEIQLICEGLHNDKASTPLALRFGGGGFGEAFLEIKASPLVVHPRNDHLAIDPNYDFHPFLSGKLISVLDRIGAGFNDCRADIINTIL